MEVSWSCSTVDRVLSCLSCIVRKALGSILGSPYRWMWYIPIIPALREEETEDQKFKVMFCYVSSSRPTWVRWLSQAQEPYGADSHKLFLGLMTPIIYILSE